MPFANVYLRKGTTPEYRRSIGAIAAWQAVK